MKTIIATLLLLLSLPAMAQEIVGTLFDEKKEPLINANVQVHKDGRIISATRTDYDGRYQVKLDSGRYDVLATYYRYDSMITTNVAVGIDKKTWVNFHMQRHNDRSDAGPIVKVYEPPALIKLNPGSDTLQMLYTNSAIGGWIWDENKKPLPNVSIWIFKDGQYKMSTVSTVDGIYVAALGTLAAPGKYDVLMLYHGYDSLLIRCVKVTSNTTQIDATMIKTKGSTTGKTTIIAGEPKYMDMNQYNNPSGKSDLLLPGRRTTPLYIIDGVQVPDSSKHGKKKHRHRKE